MQLSSIRKLAGDRALSAVQQVRTRLIERLDRSKRPSPPLPAAVDADRGVVSTVDAGEVNYYVDGSGSGRPLVLVHGVHAAASTFELRQLFQEFRGERPVYAVDLPGFGFSQRGGMQYTAQTYVRAIEHVLRHVANERPGQRADVVALSLSAEYAAAVAADLPDLIHSLVLISPTGFDQSKPHDRSEGAPAWLKAIAKNVGAPFYDLLVTKPSLKYYLRKSFVGAVDSDLFEYAYATSHQPGAQHAPLSFVAGELFPKGDPLQVYAKVSAPALIIYDQDAYTRFDAMPGFVLQHPSYQSERIAPTRGLPQIEQRERTVQCMRAFWEHVDTDWDENSHRFVRDGQPLTAAAPLN